MAITFVQEVSASVDPFTIAATGTGNLLVVLVNDLMVTTNSVTDNAGNTYVQAPGALTTQSAWNTDIWYCVNSIAGATSVTITTTPPGPALSVAFFEFSGVTYTSPLDVAGNMNQTAAAPLGPSLTAATANSLFVVISQPFDINLTGISGGWTSYQYTSGRYAGYMIASGTQQAAFTPTTAQHYITSGAVFKPATGPSGKKKGSFFLAF